MVRLALCIPTYCRGECVEEFLQKCAPYYLEEGIDIYYFDSSPDNVTEEIVKNYLEVWQDRLFYCRIPSDMHSNKKVYEIFKGWGITKEYDFLWVCSDAIQFVASAVKEIMIQIQPDYDLVVVDPRDEEVIGTKIYQDRDLFLKDCGWGMTLYGATILNTHTILKDVDWDRYEKRFLKKNIINFSHVSFYFTRIAELNQFQALHISLENRQYRSSVYKKESGWHGITFFILCESWVKTIKGLPSCYHSKRETILKGGKYSSFRGEQDFYKFRMEGIFNLKVFVRYFFDWKQVCEIPRKKLWAIALASREKMKDIELAQVQEEYKKFQKFCSKYSEIVIYGAGRVGHVYGKFFEQQNILFKGFCVSAKGEEEYLGHPVYTLQELETQMREIGVVVALQEQNAGEVIGYLEDMQLGENIFYSNRFYEIICYQLGYR